MALALQLSKTSISSDCATLVFSDTTGNYSASPPINLTGYGTPNAARADLYMLVLVNLRSNSGTDRQPIIVPAYDFNTASTWTVTLSQDGWYEIYAFSTVIYAGGTTYQLGYMTYDLATNLFYKSIQNNNIGHAVTDAAWWTSIFTIEDLINAVAIVQPNTYEVTLNDVEVCRSVKCKAKALFQAAEEISCSDSEDDHNINMYEKIRLLVEAAEVAAALSIYDDAQEFIEDISKLCVKCGCGC